MASLMDKDEKSLLDPAVRTLSSRWVSSLVSRHVRDLLDAVALLPNPSAATPKLWFAPVPLRQLATSLKSTHV